MQSRMLVAVYIDLENVGSRLSVERLMNALVLESPHENDESTPDVAFAIKAAFGRSESIGGLRQELTEFNFDIHETPHISKANAKNRADLMISVSAFEALFLDKPRIDRFVFVTSDADFTVIMDTLRKYGKEVWLVARKQDLNRRIFNNSCDRILAMEDLYARDPADQIRRRARTAKQPTKPTTAETDADRNALSLIAQVLLAQDQDSSYSSAFIGSKIHQLDRSFQLKDTTYKGLNAALKDLIKRGLLAVDSHQGNGKHLYVRVANREGLDDLAPGDQ